MYDISFKFIMSGVQVGLMTDCKVYICKLLILDGFCMNFHF